MRIPTTEQQVVLRRPAPRVRIVHAAPGSGKTWLVAELIRQELEEWPSKTSGIAALSFTHVGGDEIRKAVGNEIGHPHFVGTIDAFLFRYVVRPFFQRVYPNFSSPRIVAGEWGAEHWKYYAHKQKTSVESSAGNEIKLFGCVFVDERQGEAVVAHKPHPAQPLRELTGEDVRRVKDAKKEMWKKHGLLTHSDAALCVSKILEHKTWGPVVRAEVLRRFPFIVVDELQDTGHFLGKSIRLLLQEPCARGALVGDPDQAIYEFTGARPDLFKTFHAIGGAVPSTLANSQRCPPAVAATATYVKDSSGTIGPAKDRKGRAFLVRYTDMAADVPKIVTAARTNRAMAVVKALARATATVDQLLGRRTERAPNLHSPPLTHAHRAVVAFRRARNIAALAASRAALERLVFQHEGVNDEKLAAANIDPGGWKELAIRCLLRANAVSATCSFFDWQKQIAQILDEELGDFDLPPDIGFLQGRLKPQKRDGWDGRAADFLPQTGGPGGALAGTCVQTVHSVKGETHDVTVLICPPPADTAHCPSTVWWSTNDKSREEKRIAYVAMTRTRGDLVLCVSEPCYRRLAMSRAAFVASFECMTVTEYVASRAIGTEVALPANNV